MLEKMAEKLTEIPEAMTVRAQTVEHLFGTLKLWMGARHFLMTGGARDWASFLMLAIVGLCIAISAIKNRIQ